jgi:hypothetical protein
MYSSLKEIYSRYGFNNKVLEYIDNQTIPSELSICNTEDKRYIVPITNKELFDNGWLRFKSLFEEKPFFKDITYESFKENKIMINNKPRKLFSFLLKEHTITQKEVEKISAWTLPNKDLYFVISKNYNDFIMCSTKNSSWSSCCDITKGDYAISVLGSIFDPSRAIFYISDLAEKEYLGIRSFNMYFRTWIFINSNGSINCSLLYPSKCDNLFIPKEIFGLEIKDIDRKFLSKYPINIFFNKHNISFVPYLDDLNIVKKGKQIYLRYDPEPNIWVLEKTLTSVKRIQFDDVILKKNYLTNSSISDDLFFQKCDFCGCKNNHIHTFNGKNYCHNCYDNTLFTCENCNSKVRGDKIGKTIDDKILCNKCLKEYSYKKCISCGDYFCGTEKKCYYCLDMVSKKCIAPNCKALNDVVGNIIDLHGMLYVENNNFYKIEKHAMVCFKHEDTFLEEELQLVFDPDTCYYTRKIKR